MKFKNVIASVVLLPTVLSAEAVQVPAGTHVQLELINRLSTRASHVGDKVRAQTAFPVAIAGKVVIPAGTFAEGRLERIAPKSSGTKFFMKFDHITFANGYTVTGGDAKASAHLHMPAGAFGFQATTPTLTPPPGFGAAKALAIGGAVAVGVFTVVTLALHNRAKQSQEFTVDPGTRFEMILDNDLPIDTAEAAK